MYNSFDLRIQIPGLATEVKGWGRDKGGDPLRRRPLCSPSVANPLTDGARLVNSIWVKGKVNNWNKSRKRKIFCELVS